MGKIRDAGRESGSDAVCLEHVFALQGGGRTSSGKQGGDGWGTDVMYTLNRMEVHGVCYAIDHVVTGGVIVRLKENAGTKKYPQL